MWGPSLSDTPALFAHDSVLFSTHAKADVLIDWLQSTLNTIKRNYSTWRIKLNPSKTQAVFFTKRRTRELPTANLYLWMATLFLGVTVQSTKCNCTTHTGLKNIHQPRRTASSD
jgi:hypothetical protein